VVLIPGGSSRGGFTQLVGNADLAKRRLLEGERNNGRRRSPSLAAFSVEPTISVNRTVASMAGQSEDDIDANIAELFASRPLGVAELFADRIVGPHRSVFPTVNPRS
jgi:hypothetical protein